MGLDRTVLEGLEPVDAFDQRRFPRPGRAAHDDHLALRHRGRAILEDLESPIGLADILDLDHGAQWKRSIRNGVTSISVRPRRTRSAVGRPTPGASDEPFRVPVL